MQGYLFNFYKFSPTIVEEIPGSSTEFVRSIVWSTFDRLEIRRISKFDEYRLSKFSEKNWLGERQFAMVYEFDENYKTLVYNDKGDECKFVFDIYDESKQLNMRFFGITFIDFTPEMHAYFYGVRSPEENKPGKQIHDTMRTAIESVIKANKLSGDIAFEIYGILGGQDAVIVWLANQFEDIARVLEGLRESKTENKKAVIANIYTIVGLKDINNPDIQYSDTNGKLHIKLTKRESYDEDLFNKKLESILNGWKKEDHEFSSLFGEHDFMMTVDGSEMVPELYKREGLFNSKSEHFKSNFIQSKTEIIVDRKFDQIESYTFPELIKDGKWKKPSKNRIEEYARKIEEIIKSPCFVNNTYLQETLWLLYEDFLKNVMSSFSYPWTSDLDYQFDNCLEYIFVMIKSKLNKNKKYKNLHQLISCMRQMMLHVAQANRIFFKIPSTHLKHTGAYSKILHTYYGIVKKYLELVYSIKKFDNQSPIIPFISFDVTPIAKSKYCDYVEGYQNKIIRIELPYEALVDISKYMKLLAHEIYHYIAPANRESRNLLIAQMSFSTIMGQMVKIFIKEKIAPFLPEYVSEKKTEQEREFWDQIFTDISNIVREDSLSIPNFDNYLKAWIEGYKGNEEWKKFFNSFSRAIINGLKGKSGISSLLYELIQNIDISSEGADHITEKLIERAKQFEEQEFYKWLANDNPIERTVSEDSDLRYGLREAMADHFMIQVTGMSMEEYISLVYDYQELISSNPKHMKQTYRVALILNHYVGNEIKNEITFTNKKTGDIKQEIIDWSRKKYKFEEKPESREKIYELIGDCYTQLVLGLKLYNDIFEEYFNSLDFNRLKQKKFNPEFAKHYEEITLLLKNSSQNEFEQNIYFIENLQNQKELRSLENDIRYNPSEERPSFRMKINKDRVKISHNRDKDYEAAPKVKDLVELINVLKNSVKDIRNEEETAPIWFRGQSSKDYLLIPSLYRMKDKKSQFYNVSMRDTFSSLIDLFMAKAYSAPEMIGDVWSNKINSIISMQHYSVPTNTLDWSTSAFVAMYFALENEINKKENQELEKDTDAVIYLLNPIRLNAARENLTKSYNSMEDNDDRRIFPIMALVGESKKLKDYLPGYENKQKGKQYPIAVYAPFVNQRIKAQRGTFTLFGLDNHGNPVKNENGEIEAVDYSKDSLWTMQKDYQKWCERNSKKYMKFISKVIISKNAKRTIADSLRDLGVDKANIYPELENISQKLTDEVKSYFE